MPVVEVIAGMVASLPGEGGEGGGGAVDYK